MKDCAFRKGLQFFAASLPDPVLSQQFILLLAEHQLSFVDMNLKLEEIGMNWKTDSLDKGDHLNLSGAEKVSLYLGKYIAKEYDLPDHRGKSRYRDWTDESANYESSAKKYMEGMNVLSKT